MTELSPDQKRYARYKEIEHLFKDFEWSFKPGYANISFIAKPKTDEARALSAHDVALLADSGNPCFGGCNFHKDEETSTFSGMIYTD